MFVVAFLVGICQRTRAPPVLLRPVFGGAGAVDAPAESERPGHYQLSAEACDSGSRFFLEEAKANPLKCVELVKFLYVFIVFLAVLDTTCLSFDPLTSMLSCNRPRKFCAK